MILRAKRNCGAHCDPTTSAYDAIDEDAVAVLRLCDDCRMIRVVQGEDLIRIGQLKYRGR